MVNTSHNKLVKPKPDPDDAHKYGMTQQTKQCMEFMLKYQTLTYRFCCRVAKDTSWDYVMKHIATEEFMEKHGDTIGWDNIVRHQKLSRKFIRKHKDKLGLVKIITYQYDGCIVEEYMTEYLMSHLEKDDIQVLRDSFHN